MVSGMVRRLVEIEAGSNATESQFFIDMERRAPICMKIVSRHDHRWKPSGLHSSQDASDDLINPI